MILAIQMSDMFGFMIAQNIDDNVYSNVSVNGYIEKFYGNGSGNW